MSGNLVSSLPLAFLRGLGAFALNVPFLTQSRKGRKVRQDGISREQSAAKFRYNSMAACFI
jgi:hypothetical protein